MATPQKAPAKTEEKPKYPTLNLSMRDGSTVVLRIPDHVPGQQFFNGMRLQGYIADPDGVTFWPVSEITKAVVVQP